MMEIDSPQAHPTLLQVSDGVGTDVSPSDVPLNHQVIAEGPPYFCYCGEKFAQKESRLRHCKTKHGEHNPCVVSSCTHTWIRPHLYRSHLESCHPDDVDADKVLGKRARSRRKSKIIGRDLPLTVSPLAVEPDGQTQAEHLQYPMTTPLPTGADVTHGPSPALSPVSRGSQPEHAEPAVMSLDHEDAGGLELPGPTDDHYAFWTTERVVQLHEEVDSAIIADAGVYWMPSANPGEFTADDTHLSNPSTVTQPRTHPSWS